LTVPPKSDPRWRQIVTGEREPKLTALASKLTVARLRQTARARPESLEAVVNELFAYFAGNDFAQRDIQGI